MSVDPHEISIGSRVWWRWKTDTETPLTVSRLVDVKGPVIAMVDKRVESLYGPSLGKADWYDPEDIVIVHWQPNT